MKLRKICVPYEFTTESENAVQTAVAIASKTSFCTIELLYVIIHYTPGVNTGGALNIASAVSMDYGITEVGKITSVGETYVKEQFEQIRNKYSLSNVPIRFRIIHGEDGINFADVYTQEVADLIVYGAENVKGAEDWFLASEADEIIRKSKTPVLIVKGEKPITSFEKIVFASLFEDVTPEVAFTLRYWQELLGSKLYFVKFVESDSHSQYLQAQNEMKYFAEKYSFKNYHAEAFESSDVEKGILEYANNIKADMIVVMSHKSSSSWLKSMIRSSTEQHLANHSNLPVLVLHE
ncbi:MAG: universal stress protein [Cytophagales bacterium]|nr:universal stress protein [Cytophagales bacterium]MDW8383945.1 universal stress protein [Flammeovirgaceae bacterium]